MRPLESGIGNMMRSRKRSKDTGMSSPWITSPQVSICALVMPLAARNSFSALRLSERIAQPERLLRRRRQPAVAQIGARLGAGRRLQLLLEERRGEFHDVGQAGALLVALLGFRVARRHRHAGHFGDALDRLGKAHAVEFGEEAEMIARHAAAEAVVAALLVLAVEGRRSSRRGTGSRPNSRRAAHWSSCGPTTRACRSPRKSARGRVSRRGRNWKSACGASGNLI